ncbi:uncharacterized protein JCM6883_004109 [Sporobolomyces salmoneus]|uniref:uncharacterized protein n=1 Tax=Sporobolomyces salmoneus TaxID=183962 RepID=UPI0031716C6D
MTLEDIREEIILLQSSLIGDELRWIDEETEAAWESALADPETAPPELEILPSLLLRIAPEADLFVEYKLNDLPTFTLHAGSLDRDDQARLAAEVARETEENAQTIATLPVFTLFTSIKEWLVSNPLEPTPTSNANQEERRPAPPSSGPIALKCTLIWSHHLLATSKRKDIVAWSTELSLAGISKPGYPGVIVIEGSRENVDEFVWRIKQLQWKALQIRCEQDGDVVTVPEGVSPSDSLEWVMRKKSRLGPVLSTDPNDKIRVNEVEGLNDLGDIMRQAGLEDVFLTALKISK